MSGETSSFHPQSGKRGTGPEGKNSGATATKAVIVRLYDARGPFLSTEGDLFCRVALSDKNTVGQKYKGQWQFEDQSAIRAEVSMYPRGGKALSQPRQGSKSGVRRSETKSTTANGGDSATTVSSGGSSNESELEDPSDPRMADALNYTVDFMDQRGGDCDPVLITIGHPTSPIYRRYHADPNKALIAPTAPHKLGLDTIWVQMAGGTVAFKEKTRPQTPQRSSTPPIPNFAKSTASSASHVPSPPQSALPLSATPHKPPFSASPPGDPHLHPYYAPTATTASSGHSMNRQSTGATSATPPPRRLSPSTGAPGPPSQMYTSRKSSASSSSAMGGGAVHRRHQPSAPQGRRQQPEPSLRHPVEKVGRHHREAALLRGEHPMFGGPRRMQPSGIMLANFLQAREGGEAEGLHLSSRTPGYPGNTLAAGGAGLEALRGVPLGEQEANSLSLHYVAPSVTSRGLLTTVVGASSQPPPEKLASRGPGSNATSEGGSGEGAETFYPVASVLPPAPLNEPQMIYGRSSSQYQT